MIIVRKKVDQELSRSSQTIFNKISNFLFVWTYYYNLYYIMWSKKVYPQKACMQSVCIHTLFYEACMKAYLNFFREACMEIILYCSVFYVAFFESVY
jgi:hypothetical protein